MKKESKTPKTEAEVRLRFVLVRPPAGVDYGVQEGKGNDYTTIHKQRSKDADLTFEFTVTVKDFLRFIALRVDLVRQMIRS